MSTDFYDKAVAVDPRGCGCNECSTGEYVNAETLLDWASDEVRMRLVNLELANNMGSSWDYKNLRDRVISLMGISAPELAFPCATQIDPKGCGCMECGNDEYVEFSKFAAEAEEGDLDRLKSGAIRCDYESEFELTEIIERRLGLGYYPDED